MISRWDIFFWSVPALLVLSDFFYFEIISWASFAIFLICLIFTGIYAAFVPFYIIHRILNNWRLGLIILTSYVATIYLTVSFKLYKLLFVLGFAFYIFPKDLYVSSRCHPIQFVQDGIPYYVGICETKRAPGADDGFTIVYDTSGDVADDFGKKAKNHSLDRIEWVTALRTFPIQFPLISFEVAGFSTTRVYDNFYAVSFNRSDNQGFTSEYGPPKQ